MYIDLHNDTITKIIHENLNFAEGAPSLNIDLPKILASKITGGLFFALWSDPMFKGDEATNNIMFMSSRLRRELERCNGKIRPVFSKGDINKALTENKTMAVIAIEGGLAINDNISNLEKFYNEGIREITLTHIESLSWAGSMSDQPSKGLNNLGQDIVKEMNELGMIVDVAHVSERTIFDTVSITKKPIVYTHTGARGAYDNERCLSDDAIKAIASTGGVVGVAFFPEFLENNPFLDNSFIPTFMKEIKATENREGMSAAEKSQRLYDFYAKNVHAPSKVPGLEAIFKHVDYIVKLVGEDFVGLGSDFDGIPYSCAGLEDISKIGNLIRVFETNGYNKKRIEKILSGNILRVMNDCFENA